MKKKTKLAFLLCGLCSLLSGIYLIYYLFTLSNIENVLRYMGIGIIAFINLLLFVCCLKVKSKTKLLKRITLLFFLIIMMIIQTVGGYFIGKVMNSLGNMNKDTLTYRSGVYVLEESKITSLTDLKDKKIALAKDETSISDYILPNKIIKNHSLEKNNSILYYDTTDNLVNDLISKKIDCFIANDEILNSIDDEDILSAIKEIYSLENTYTKKEIEKLTGEQMTYSNNSIDKPFTVLLMGMDAKLSGRSDTMIVVTFNPKTLNATMLSIPRDSYVTIYCSNGARGEAKINSAGSCITKTIEKLLDVKIDHYAKINFAGLVKLVDSLGGIEVDVPYSFCEQNSKRQFGKNMVYVEKGLQTLSGEQALALSRNRHYWTSKCAKKWTTEGPRNDFVRGQNQQLVIQGIINKLKAITNPTQLLDLLDTISKNMDTSFSTDQILSFYNIGKDLLKTSNSDASSFLQIDKLYLRTTNQYINSLSMEIINQESLSKVQSAMAQNLEKEKVSWTKKMDYNINEEFEPVVIGKKVSASTKLYDLVPDFTKYTRSKINTWASSRGITINYEEFETSDSKYTDGQVLSQSIKSGKRVDQIDKTTGITIKIVKKITIYTPPVTEDDNSTDNKEENNNNNNQTDSNENNNNEITEENKSDE